MGVSEKPDDEAGHDRVGVALRSADHARRRGSERATPRHFAV